MQKECLRCATLSDVDSIGAVLVHFVCRTCRMDSQDWVFRTKDFNDIPVTLHDMKTHVPLSEGDPEKDPNGELSNL